MITRKRRSKGNPYRKIITAVHGEKEVRAKAKLRQKLHAQTRRTPSGAKGKTGQEVERPGSSRNGSSGKNEFDK